MIYTFYKQQIRSKKMVVSLMLQTALGIRAIALHERKNRARKMRLFILGNSRMISYQYQHLVYTIVTSFLGSKATSQLLEKHLLKRGQ